MPAKDIYHNTVRAALEKDGWTITDDPLKLKWGIRELFIDLVISLSRKTSCAYWYLTRKRK